MEVFSQYKWNITAHDEQGARINYKLDWPESASHGGASEKSIYISSLTCVKGLYYETEKMIASEKQRKLQEYPT